MGFPPDPTSFYIEIYNPWAGHLAWPKFANNVVPEAAGTDSMAH